MLQALVDQRKHGALDYKKYLEEITELARELKAPGGGQVYPETMDSAAKRALFDNLGKNEPLANAIDASIRAVKKDDWRSNEIKRREVRNAIKGHIADDATIDRVFDLVRAQHDY